MLTAVALIAGGEMTRAAAVVLVAVPLFAAAAAPSARTVLRNAEGKQVGTATFTQADAGVTVHVAVAGLTPGRHGIHVHAVGKCDPPDFKSAGPHFNPFGRQHGILNPLGAHAGDLANLEVGKDGKATATFTARGATLEPGQGSLLGPEGAALVVHADPDDEKTDPAGNSGARVACGVISRE
jgi:Cu-Zn family superoxide dismutase